MMILKRLTSNQQSHTIILNPKDIQWLLKKKRNHNHKWLLKTKGKMIQMKVHTNQNTNILQMMKIDQ